MIFLGSFGTKSTSLPRMLWSFPSSTDLHPPTPPSDERTELSSLGSPRTKRDSSWRRRFASESNQRGRHFLKRHRPKPPSRRHERTKTPREWVEAQGFRGCRQVGVPNMKLKVFESQHLKHRFHSFWSPKEPILFQGGCGCGWRPRRF